MVIRKQRRHVPRPLNDRRVTAKTSTGSLQQGTEPLRENIERLKSIFREECLRHDAFNNVPAVIEEQPLLAAIRLSGIRAGQLTESSPDSYQLECLHGQDRIQAAKELRLQWWAVDLYLAGTAVISLCYNSSDVYLNRPPSQPGTYLAEEYANGNKPSDGEIYRKIRQYHFQLNLRFEWR